MECKVCGGFIDCEGRVGRPPVTCDTGDCRRRYRVLDSRMRREQAKAELERLRELEARLAAIVAA